MRTIFQCLLLTCLMSFSAHLIAQDGTGTKPDVDKLDRQPSLSDSVVSEPIGDLEPLAEPTAGSQVAPKPSTVAVPVQEALPPDSLQPTMMTPALVSPQLYPQAETGMVVWGTSAVPACCEMSAISVPASIASPINVACESVGTPPCCVVCPPVEPACCCQIARPRCRLLRRIGCRR